MSIDTTEITMSDAPNVVLVHGGCVDGSGWEGDYHLLRQDGLTVSIVQNPTLSLHGDVAATGRATTTEAPGSHGLYVHSAAALR